MRILSALIIIGVIVGIVVLVVILQAATRNIAVQMSQKVQGRRQVGGQQSNIPLKVNTAGVIPTAELRRCRIPCRRGRRQRLRWYRCRRLG